MRVFIGLTEIANVTYTYGKGFRALGADTFTAVMEKAWAYPDSTYDVVVHDDYGRPFPGRSIAARLRRLGWSARYYAILLRAALTCDAFVFVFGSSFRADRSDYRLLKRLGKRIACVFLGDDARYWYAYTQEAERSGVADEIRPYLDEVLRDRADDYLAVKLATVRDAEAAADVIVALPDAAQLQSRPYMRLNIPIDLSTVPFDVPDREVPLVVHAPSVRGIKGTDHVLAAVERLRADGVPFDFELVERRPNRYVRELLGRSDILVDQLYSETIATLALEGLASGNVVLARYLPDRLRIPEDCPVVNVTVHTVADRLREVIVDRALRRRLAEKGRQYVARHHDHVKVAAELLQWLEPGGTEEPHFVPTFFREHFVMSRDVEAREADARRSSTQYLRAVPLDDIRFAEAATPSVANDHAMPTGG